MTRFVEYQSQTIVSIAEAVGVSRIDAVERVLATLTAHAQTLMIAARSEHAPVLQIESTIVALLHEEAAREVLTADQVLNVVTRGIDHIVGVEGYVAVRAEPVAFGEKRQTGSKVYYYRPSELSLFDVIDRSQPVVLATTVDARRFGRAVVRRYMDDTEGPHRRVFLWTIGSGLFEVAIVDGTLTYFPAGSPELYTIEVVIRTLSDICSELDADRGYIISRLSIEGVATYSHEGHDIACFHISDETDALSCEQQIILDNYDDAGEVIELDEGTLIQLRARFLPELFRARTSKDRWPRTNAKGETEDRMSFANLLDFIMQRQTRGALFIVYDGEVFLDQKEHGNVQATIAAAFLRDACVRLRRGATGTQIVVLSAPIVPPTSLTAEVTHVDLPLPTRQELLAEIRQRKNAALGSTESIGLDPDSIHLLQTTDGLLNIVDAAAGMTLTDVANAMRLATTSGVRDDSELVLAINAAKRTAIRRSAALELLDREPPRELMLGGMENFWRWLETRHRVFKHPELASQFGIDKRPKGVLILGIPGTGKSLAAKLIAREWQVPLVRLDMGALQNRWVGASEERIREALQIVQAMSPCVLWIDEIDKGIAQGEGTSSNSVDLNIRATLLTWLQEHDSAVYVVATANRFANLPPELTRAGRFDARFFFGCPNQEGCNEILKIHLDLRRVSGLSAESLANVASTMHGFTGAEIEQAVLDGLYAAFASDRPVTSEDLMTAAAHVKPLVKAAGRGLEEVWALLEEGRVELASDRFLTRADVAKLIDPESFSPMYCRLDQIQGWEKHASRAQRLLMRDQLGLPAAVVLGTGDDTWAYVQTNFRLEPDDPGNFKFLDQLKEIDTNSVFDRLVVECALETIWFENAASLKRFTDYGSLGAYAELCRVLTNDEKEKRDDVSVHTG